MRRRVVFGERLTDFHRARWTSRTRDRRSVQVRPDSKSSSWGTRRFCGATLVCSPAGGLPAQGFWGRLIRFSGAKLAR